MEVSSPNITFLTAFTCFDESFSIYAYAAMIFVARKFDMKNEENVKMARLVFVAGMFPSRRYHSEIYLKQ